MIIKPTATAQTLILAEILRVRAALKIPPNPDALWWEIERKYYEEFALDVTTKAKEQRKALLQIAALTLAQLESLE